MTRDAPPAIEKGARCVVALRALQQRRRPKMLLTVKLQGEDAGVATGEHRVTERARIRPGPGLVARTTAAALPILVRRIWYGQNDAERDHRMPTVLIT